MYSWLSETPGIPAKAAWPGGFGLPRVCCRLMLRDRQTGRTLHYFNTHFDGGETGQRESAQVIVRRARALGEGEPVFCTADFNFAPDSAGFHSMRTYFRDVRETIAPENRQATLNCYVEQGDRIGWLIDFCFYAGKNVTPTKYEVIKRLYDGKFPSDHSGMVYDFQI